MTIAASDIKKFLSGGAGNADPNASLGGIISANEVGAGLHNLFDIVASAEASAGDDEYRCFYIKNTHATLTLQNAAVWVQTETGGTNVDELIGLGTSAINGTEQTIANEDTAPAGVTFAQANGEGSGLAIGDLAPGDTKAVWIKRAITAGAPAQNSLTSTIRVGGDSLAA